MIPATHLTPEARATIAAHAAVQRAQRQVWRVERELHRVLLRAIAGTAQ